MSDSENESDFASAESDQEEPKTQPVNTSPSKEQQGPSQQENVSLAPAEPESPPAPHAPEDKKSTERDIEAHSEQTLGVDDKDSEKQSETLPVQDEQHTLETDDTSSKTEAATDKTDTITENQIEQSPKAEVTSEVPVTTSKDVLVTKESGGGWGWGGWGSSLWSSVSTVTESAQALGSKVTSVITSVEEGLGLPSPDEMANSKESEEERELVEDVIEHDVKPVVEEPHKVPDSNNPERDEDSESYGGFLSGLASAGAGLVSGGLDALETLGKKTMEVLSEGDPGLQKKRALLGGQGSPTLSQLLQQAKSQAEAASEATSKEGDVPVNYSRLFDEYHGVVHLEALELLSKECAAKVQTGSPSVVDEDVEALKKRVGELEECFQVEEDQEALDDDSSKLPEVLELFSSSKLPIKVDKLVKVSNAWRDKVEQTTPIDVVTSEPQDTTPSQSEETPVETKDLKEVSQALYDDGLRSLAELTSASIELFRKTAELTLLPDAEKGDPIAQAKKLNRLTVLVCSELDCLASVHSESITKLDLPHTNSSVTSLYLEASNSSTYVQDAFQLLLPVLKFTQIQQLSAEVPQPNVLTRT